ncbi:hypothetical protein GCM10022243_45920 [Saccharothrix violaceirubra]|uniref:Lipoprotein n=1 Tax=Saccharothrix violaceirubra TaxID=413306 RepID=A0A7W7WVG8_9PSEU|nr:hypothetical protein [Saccharothrix violaceirubra]MBB4964518.1 hypothetical protein [Saccharothrix violaceirubra]
MGYKRVVKRWVWVVVGLVVLAGCSVPVPGTPVAEGRAIGVKKTYPEAVMLWMANWCGVADYLVASGQTEVAEPAADPAVAKKQLSDQLGRLVDVLDVVLHDLGELTPAPAPAAETAVDIVTEHLTKARDKFAAAKEILDDADRLTDDVFASVTRNLGDATATMAEAVEKMNAITLPPDFVEAGKQTGNCTGK